MARLPMVAEIKRAVASEYGVTVAALGEPAPLHDDRRNPRTVSHPRQVAMLLATRLTNHSCSRIGHFFGGRDHSTVHHACRAVERRRKRDPELHNTLRRLTFELVHHA